MSTSAGCASYALVAIALALAGLSSCTSAGSVGHQVVEGAVSHQVVEGELRRSKGGFAVGKMSFQCDDEATMSRIGEFMGKNVRMTGRLVKHEVRCTTPQCRTGGWYYTFEPLDSIEEKP